MSEDAMDGLCLPESSAVGPDHGLCCPALRGVPGFTGPGKGRLAGWRRTAPDLRPPKKAHTFGTAGNNGLREERAPGAAAGPSPEAWAPPLARPALPAQIPSLARKVKGEVFLTPGRRE